MAERQLVRKIQDMIDQTDERRKLGRVNLDKIQHFNINRPNLAEVDPEYDPSGRRQDTGSKKVPARFIEWNYSAFNHDRGKFYNPDPLNWKVGPRHQQKRGTFNSDSRGNFVHSMNIGNNANIKYHAVMDVGAAVTHKIRLQFTGTASVGVYLKKVSDLGYKKQYTSGYNNAHNQTTAIPLSFPEAGKYLVTIYVYQQDQTYSIGGVRTTLSGDLSTISSAPAAISPPEIVVTFNTSAGGGTPAGGKSEFIDGANGPTLANIVYWDRVKQDSLDELSTDFDIAGYRLLNIRYETLDYQVVSGWGTDGFMVTGDKHADFPIGLDIRTWGGTSWDDHQVSGTFHFIASETASGNVETLVVTSGTGGASGGEFIQVEQSLFVQDIPYDTQTGPVVSGTHQNIKAGESYTYEVQLYDRFGNVFPRTQSITFTSGDDITAPGKVTGVTAGGGNKRIMLGWVNPSDTDIKGFNIWDTDNPTLGVDTPIKTIVKGGVNETLVTGTYISQLSDRTELVDNTAYTFYVSTFDWAGNETLTSLPNAGDTTKVSITTQQSGKRVELDSTNNEFRYYDSGDNLVFRAGENVNDSGVAPRDGIKVTDGLIYADKTISSDIVFPDIFFSPMYSISTVNGDVEQAPYAAAITGYKALQHDQTIDRVWAGVEGVADNSVGSGIDTGTTIAAIYGKTEGTYVEDVTFSGYFENDVFIGGKLKSDNWTIKENASDNLLISGTNKVLIGTEENTSKLTVGDGTTGHEIALNWETGNRGIKLQAPSDLGAVINFASDDLAIISADDGTMMYFDGPSGTVEFQNSGTVAGTPMLLTFGYNDNISASSTTTTQEMKTVDGSENGQGYRMLRAGKVTGISAQYDIISATGLGTVSAQLRKNNSQESNVVTVNSSPSATGDAGSNTIAGTTVSFSAGDRLSVDMILIEVEGSTLTIDDVAVVLEITYDV